MMLRFTVTALAACLCLTPGPLSSFRPLQDQPMPPLCLAAAPEWARLHAPCPVMPVDPFESVGARLWLLHVR